MIQARNIDFSTFPSSVSYSVTAKGTHTFDCSFIPSGRKFVIMSDGYVNIKNGVNWSINSSYNGISSRAVWVDNKGSVAAALPLSSIQLCTKISGIDTLTFTSNAAHTNVTEVSHTIVVFVV